MMLYVRNLLFFQVRGCVHAFMDVMLQGRFTIGPSPL